MATKSKATKKETETLEDIVRRIVGEEVRKHLKIEGCYYDGAGHVELLWGKKEIASSSL